MCTNLGWVVKKWSKRHCLFFFGKNWTKSPETKRCARSKLMGVEEEKIEKKVIIEGVMSISNSEFFHLQRRMTGVELRP